MPEWDSSPSEDPPILTTSPVVFRTIPPVRMLGHDGLPRPEAPSPEEIIEWEGSPERTTYGPPAVLDFTKINPDDAGLRKWSRAT